MSKIGHKIVNILGVKVSAIDMDGALQACDQALVSDGGYICVTGVHGVMEAQKDPQFLEILNHAFLAVPDGMPLVWVGRLHRYESMGRVYGPDLMIELCRRSVARGYRHFFYGGKEGVAQDLASNLQQRVPGLRIVGTYTPPFRPLTAAEECELLLRVAESKPDIIWVGLSTPKQERFMAKYADVLDARLMIGVGAAFDLHTGRMKDAPRWMKSFGLQWLHRLCQEPRRLWRRYLVNNPLFLYRIMLQLTGITKYP